MCYITYNEGNEGREAQNAIRCKLFKPAKDFIDGLDKKLRTKVLRSINLLQDNGNETREPDSKPLEDGIFELRTSFGGNITRVLYFFYVGQRIILTNGFVKKTNKTPPAEIAIAKKYRADFLEREKEHERI